MKRNISILMALILGSILILTGCNKNESPQPSGETVEITHELGTSNIPKNPQRIAVAEFGTLDALDKLGLGEKVVAVTQDSSLPSYISHYNDKKYENIGGLKEINMEKLHAAQPDLIIIGGRQSESYEELSKIAPVLYVNTTNWEISYMENLKKNMGMIGEIFDAKDKVDAEIEAFEKRIEALHAKVAENEATAVVTLLNDRSLNALGKKSRCSLISNELGFDNLAQELTNSTHGSEVSWEFLVEKDPEYLFILDRNLATKAEGAESAKSIVENDMVKKTKAYQNGNIVYLTPEPWYLAEGGLYATDAMLTEVEKVFE